MLRKRLSRWLAWTHNEEEEEEEVPLLHRLTPATQVKSRRQRDETKIMKKTLIERAEKIVKNKISDRLDYY